MKDKRSFIIKLVTVICIITFVGTSLVPIVYQIWNVFFNK